MTDKKKPAPLGAEWDALNDAVLAYMRACRRENGPGYEHPIAYGISALLTAISNAVDAMAEAGELPKRWEAIEAEALAVSDWTKITSEWNTRHFWPLVEASIEEAEKGSAK